MNDLVRSDNRMLARLCRLAACLLLSGLAGAAVAAGPASAERARLAEAYFRVAGFDAMYGNPDRILAMVGARLRSMDEGMAARATPAQLAEFRRGLNAAEPEIRRIVADTVRRMRPDMVKAVANTYSDAELRALVEFYGSPVGRSVVAKNPRLMESMGRASGNHMGAMMKELDKVLAAKVGPAGKTPAKGK